MTEREDGTIALLEAQLGGSGLHRVETHISLILMNGTRVFKIKKALKLPYADFSTPERRLAACENEFRLNRRTAPDLYHGVHRITSKANGELELDGPGELVDATVEMRRFDEDQLFDRLADRGKLDLPLMEETALAIARFHGQAEALHKGSGAANLRAVLDINRAGFATSHAFEPQAVSALDHALRQRLSRHADLLDERERDGKLKLCHGDLHLRNIYRAEDGPCLFDCIEFNDTIASVDVLYDLAFLLMDLWHRGLNALANAVTNRYLDRTGDDGGFALLPFLMAIRAEVRAHVTATQAENTSTDGASLRALAGEYFTLAGKMLRETPPRLITIGGLSGSGKSTLATALAPRLGAAPGARLLESDRIRKALFGAGLGERLPPEAYRPDASQAVYRLLFERTRAILANGGCVVADAVFDRAEDRTAMAEIAATLGVPFTGLWLDIDAQSLKRRVAARRQGDSDATVDVLEKQLSRDIGQLDWTRLDAASSSRDLVTQALGRV